jgi:hypothetical protein
MALFCITAVHAIGDKVTRVRMGEADGQLGEWRAQPFEVEVAEAVRRVERGDDVVTVFTHGGHQVAGPAIRVVDRDGLETIDMLGDPVAGRGILDLPRF